MNRSVAIGYGVGIIGLLLAGFALLAPARLVNAAREQLVVTKTAIVDANFPERSASVDAFGRLKVDVPDYLHVQVTNFPPGQQVQVTNKSLSVDGTVKVSNLPPVQPVTGVVNVGNLPATQNVNVTNRALSVGGSVAVSNLPTVQQVQGTVSIGNFPRLDVAQLIYLHGLSVKVGGDWGGVCTKGFSYKVPVGKVLLVSDITYRTDGGNVAALWVDGATIGQWRTPSNGSQHLNLTTPLAFTEGQTLCPLPGDDTTIIDLSLVGQLVDVP